MRKSTKGVVNYCYRSLSASRILIELKRSLGLPIADAIVDLLLGTPRDVTPLVQLLFDRYDFAADQQLRSVMTSHQPWSALLSGLDGS